MLQGCQFRNSEVTFTFQVAVCPDAEIGSVLVPRGRFRQADQPIRRVRILWTDAPRWLHVPVYIALGWVAGIYLPSFWQSGGTAVVTLLFLGGLLYTLGAVVYGLRRPDPNPRWFGFHEVFHTVTIAAFTAHCIGIAIALRTTAA